jgi:hypothetical protein
LYPYATKEGIDMELHKKKETLWSINKNDSKSSIHLKSIEEAGVLTSLLIGVKNVENEIFFEMNPSEFDNFFSILKSFKSLLLSRNSISSDENLDFASESIKNCEGNNQSIEETTKQALDDLRQKEINSNIPDNLQNSDLTDKQNMNDDLEITEEDLINNEDQSQTEEEFDINTEEIFNALDTIEPSIEPGKVLEGLNATTVSQNEVKTIHENSDGDNKKDTKELNQQKLNPKEWDPW